MIGYDDFSVHHARHGSSRLSKQLAGARRLTESAKTGISRCGDGPPLGFWAPSLSLSSISGLQRPSTCVSSPLPSHTTHRRGLHRRGLCASYTEPKSIPSPLRLFHLHCISQASRRHFAHGLSLLSAIGVALVDSTEPHITNEVRDHPHSQITTTSITSHSRRASYAIIMSHVRPFDGQMLSELLIAGWLAQMPRRPPLDFVY